MTTEREFEAAVAKAPESIRDSVYDIAWGNAWSVECYVESKTDAERWSECIFMVEMILDAPADYGL